MGSNPVEARKFLGSTFAVTYRETLGTIFIFGIHCRSRDISRILGLFENIKHMSSFKREHSLEISHMVSFKV